MATKKDKPVLKIEEKRRQKQITAEQKAEADDQKFLDLANKRLKKAIDADDHNRKAGVEDLEFLEGNQWDDAEKTKRNLQRRPCLTMNLLSKYVDQVVGDERHNRPKIKVRAVDSNADVRIARIREGIICNIEYLSNAEAIYDYACEMQTSCGYGAWWILTRYTEENPFLQEIYMQLIQNPFMAFLDPSAKDPNGADAEWGFLLEKLSNDDFKEQFPKAKSTGEGFDKSSGTNMEHWYDDQTVTVAHYFVKTYEKKTICLMEDGSILDKQDADDLIKAWKTMNEQEPAVPKMEPVSPVRNPTIPDEGTIPDGTAINPEAGMIPPEPEMQPAMEPPAAPELILPEENEKPEEPKIKKEREHYKCQIKHYLITASEILGNAEDVPGKFIPIVIVKGRERNIEGKQYIRSLIRNAKDPQRMVNYWNTLAAETIALQPKAPYIGTAKMFEGFESDWASANTENIPFMKFNPDPSMAGAIPLRQPPQQPPMAVFHQMDKSEDLLKSAIGMFKNDVGEPTGEQTGLAVMRKQTPGDVSTFAFVDNLSKAVAYSGRIINEMIPEVYDTERDIRLRNIDDTDTFTPVNTTAENAAKLVNESPEKYNGIDKEHLQEHIRKYGANSRYNDLTVGKYDTVITVQPSYTTQRQEASQNLLTLATAYPALMQLAGDIIVRNMDFLNSDELAARLKKTVPSGLVTWKQGEDKPEPPPPDPKVQLDRAKIEVQKMKQDTEMARIQVQKIRVLNELTQSKVEMKAIVMELLQELFAPPGQHKADKLTAQQMKKRNTLATAQNTENQEGFTKP